MEYFVGIGLAAAVALLAAVGGFDRDRAFYPTVAIIVASYYGLFAVLGEDVAVLSVETAIAALFTALAVVGFRTSLWLVVAALVGHGVFDVFHGAFITNPGLPSYWPAFCATFDVAIGGWLAWRLISPRRLQPQDRARTAGARLPAPPVGRVRLARTLARLVEAELLAARELEAAGDAKGAFHHLERAHVLGQASTVNHVRVHIKMLAWSLRARDLGEAMGQLFRIIAAALFTPFGLVPHGNTGGSNVNPFRAMPIAEDLARSLPTPVKRARPVLASLLGLGLVLYGAGGSAAADSARTVEVAGRTMVYSLSGSGRPAVVFITGLGPDRTTFSDVAAEIARSATVITYDRSGYGGSAAQGAPRDAARADAELSEFLTRSGVPGPYILIGHSIGGLYAEYFAAHHADQVAGLILEDSRPADFGRRCQAAIHTEPCTPTLEMVKTAPAGVQEDVAGIEAAFAQVEATAPNRAIPVLILSRPVAAGARPFLQLWAQAQNDLAARYPGAIHLTAPGGGHDIHKDQNAWFLSTVETWISQTAKKGTRP